MNGAPLSGSHSGPHDRSPTTCNKAVFREAVRSSFTHFNATACSSTSDPTHVEVIDDKYKYRLPSKGSPFKGLAISAHKEILYAARLAFFTDALRIDHLANYQLSHLLVYAKNLRHLYDPQAGLTLEKAGNIALDL